MEESLAGSAHHATRAKSETRFAVPARLGGFSPCACPCSRLLLSLWLPPPAGAGSSSDATGASNDAITASSSTPSAGTSTQIVRSSGAKDSAGAVHVGVALGFEDSAFDGDTKGFCYLGSADQVCAQVSKYETAMNAAYASGAHDAIGVHGCTLSQKDNRTVVTLSYNLSDDYGDNLDLEKTIAPCWSYEASPPPRTKIYTGGASIAKDGSIATSPTLGFHDSTFDSDDKAFCYVGAAADVCPIVSTYASGMDAQYGQGAHDTMAVKSCTAAGSAITATYDLSDDYGGNKTVTTTIKACGSF